MRMLPQRLRPRNHWLLAVISAGLLAAAACSDSSENTATGGSGAGTGTGTASGTGTGDGGAGTGTASGTGTGTASGTGTGTGGAGGTGAGLPPPTEEVPCLNQIYECGDLEDNDGDGLIDYQDPDCLGPCDNTEDSYYPDLPGASGQNCDLDCFWDTGQGHNWDCYWDHQCDPLADLANNAEANPQPTICTWDSDADGPVGGQTFSPSPYTCDENFNDQPQECLDQCEPLAPNGCDCFGCCQIGGEGNPYVWVGTVDGDTNNGTCTIEAVGQQDYLDKCKPCTPVPGCNNPCATCELCIGKTTLPPECFGQGGGGQGGNGQGGNGTGGSGGSPQVCPDGQQACGLPGQPACPSGNYCITGCCVPLPQ